MTPADGALERLTRRAEHVVKTQDLADRLAEGKKLRVKLGLDPTARDVTLGWAVPLRKLRDFQDEGHTAVLIVGDFTARIGDPSGKSETRPQLSKEEVQANAEQCVEQLLLRSRAGLDREALSQQLFEGRQPVAHTSVNPLDWVLAEHRRLFFAPTAPGVAYAYIPDYRRNRPDVFTEAGSLNALAEKLGKTPIVVRAATFAEKAAWTRKSVELSEEEGDYNPNDTLAFPVPITDPTV